MRNDDDDDDYKYFLNFYCYNFFFDWLNISEMEKFPMLDLSGNDDDNNNNVLEWKG